MHCFFISLWLARNVVVREKAKLPDTQSIALRRKVLVQTQHSHNFVIYHL